MEMPTFNKMIKPDSETGFDKEFSFESNPIPVTDSMGREVFWEDMGRPDSDIEASKGRHENTPSK